LLPSAAKLGSAARAPARHPRASTGSHSPASAPPVRPPPACPRAREPRSATRCACGRPPPDQRRHLPTLQLRQVRHRPQGRRDARAKSPSRVHPRPSCLEGGSRAVDPPSSEITATRLATFLSTRLVQPARSSLIADRGAYGLATDDPLQAHLVHQPVHGAAGEGEFLPPHLPPDLPHPKDREARICGAKLNGELLDHDPLGSAPAGKHGFCFYVGCFPVGPVEASFTRGRPHGPGSSATRPRRAGRAHPRGSGPPRSFSRKHRRRRSPRGYARPQKPGRH